MEHENHLGNDFFLVLFETNISVFEALDYHFVTVIIGPFTNQFASSLWFTICTFSFKAQTHLVHGMTLAVLGRFFWAGGPQFSPLLHLPFSFYICLSSTLQSRTHFSYTPNLNKLITSEYQTKGQFTILTQANLPFQVISV